MGANATPRDDQRGDCGCSGKGPIEPPNPTVFSTDATRDRILARPRRFELLTPRSVVWCSIQLSYGRAGVASDAAGGT